MATDKATVERLTHAELARQIARYSERDRELTNELAAMYASRKAGAPEVEITTREKSARELAREMLSDQGHLISMPTNGRNEADLYVERDAVRLILAALQKQDVEARAVEAAQWALDNLPAWRALCRARIFAQIAIDGADERIDAFLEMIDGDQRGALPLGFSWRDIDADLIAHAIEEGLATRPEIERALRSAKKGQPETAG